MLTFERDTTELFDPSPDVKFLLGQALCLLGSSTSWGDDPKFAAPEQTAVGSYSVVEYGVGDASHQEIVNAFQDDFLTQANTPRTGLLRSKFITETPVGRTRITLRSKSASNSPVLEYVVGNWTRRLRRVQVLREYIEKTVASGHISKRTGNEAMVVWNYLSSATSSALSVPNCAAGEGGRLQFVWDSGRNHLEIEFEPGLPASLFYANRDFMSLSWESEFYPSSPMDKKALAVLGIFSDRKDD
jgi:hypothetical protein